MLLPEKHVGVSESIIGLGFVVLKQLDSPRSVDDLWQVCASGPADTLGRHRHSFDDLVLALCFLFAIGAIAQHADGSIIRETA